MNQYAEALERAGYDIWPLENGFIQIFLLESRRWWREEGDFVEEGDYIFHINALISRDAVLEFIDSHTDGGGLCLQPYYHKSAEQMAHIIQQARTAYSDETALEDATRIMRSLLT